MQISNLLVFCGSRSGTKYVEVVLGFVLTPEHNNNQVAVGEGKKPAQNAQNSSHSQCQMEFSQIGTSEGYCTFSVSECKELSLQVPQHSPEHHVRFSSTCKHVYQVSALKKLLFGSKETKYLHIAFLGNRGCQC